MYSIFNPLNLEYHKPHCSSGFFQLLVLVQKQALFRGNWGRIPTERWRRWSLWLCPPDSQRHLSLSLTLVHLRTQRHHSPVGREQYIGYAVGDSVWEHTNAGRKRQSFYFWIIAFLIEAKHKNHKNQLPKFLIKLSWAGWLNHLFNY